MNLKRISVYDVDARYALLDANRAAFRHGFAWIDEVHDVPTGDQPSLTAE